MGGGRLTERYPRTASRLPYASVPRFSDGRQRPRPSPLPRLDLAGVLARLCTQYGIRTTVDWHEWAEKL